MQRSTFLIFAALVTGAAHVRAQGLLESIITPEKAVATVNQTLEGTWLLEVRRPGAPVTLPPDLGPITFQPDGTSVASPADGTQSTNHGVWVRVGGRKYLLTMFVFNSTRAGSSLPSLIKVRINVQVSPDGQTVKGTTELVILDKDGKMMATIPGGTYSGVRLSPEIPGDFYDFQKVQ
jgi:hypothetical protein